MDARPNPAWPPAPEQPEEWDDWDDEEEEWCDDDILDEED